MRFAKFQSSLKDVVISSSRYNEGVRIAELVGSHFSLKKWQKVREKYVKRLWPALPSLLQMYALNSFPK